MYANSHSLLNLTINKTQSHIESLFKEARFDEIEELIENIYNSKLHITRSWLFIEKYLSLLYEQKLFSRYISFYDKCIELLDQYSDQQKLDINIENIHIQHGKDILDKLDKEHQRVQHDEDILGKLDKKYQEVKDKEDILRRIDKTKYKEVQNIKDNISSITYSILINKSAYVSEYYLSLTFLNYLKDTQEVSKYYDIFRRYFNDLNPEQKLNALLSFPNLDYKYEYFLDICNIYIDIHKQFINEVRAFMYQEHKHWKPLQIQTNYYDLYIKNYIVAILYKIEQNDIIKPEDIGLIKQYLNIPDAIDIADKDIKKYVLEFFSLNEETSLKDIFNKNCSSYKIDCLNIDSYEIQNIYLSIDQAKIIIGIMLDVINDRERQYNACPHLNDYWKNKPSPDYITLEELQKRFVADSPGLFIIPSLNDFYAIYVMCYKDSIKAYCYINKLKESILDIYSQSYNLRNKYCRNIDIKDINIKDILVFMTPDDSRREELIKVVDEKKEYMFIQGRLAGLYPEILILDYDSIFVIYKYIKQPELYQNDKDFKEFIDKIHEFNFLNKVFKGQNINIETDIIESSIQNQGIEAIRFATTSSSRLFNDSSALNSSQNSVKKSTKLSNILTKLLIRKK